MRKFGLEKKRKEEKTTKTPKAHSFFE